MKQTALLLLLIIAVKAFPQAIGKRVIHNSPAAYRVLPAVHAGAGQMKFTGLFGSQPFATNFLYLHAGEIPDKAGIGQHFHHTIEEMYVILDGEAEFTVNGHTSRIKGPALVPCKMGDAHGIYNSSGKTLRWLNFAVSTTKGLGDNFDLGDTRVGATLEPIPQFVSGQLKRDLLKPNSAAYKGNGILYRRILGPDIFSTSWDHVDHVVIPAGTTTLPRVLEGMEEVYYVVRGSGTISMNADSASIGQDDAVYGSLGETVKIAGTGKEDLELLVIGIAASRQKDAMRAAKAPKEKAMALQMEFVVAKDQAEAFEKMYTSVYVPALMVQQGYLSSKLLRIFPDSLAKEIQAEATAYNYQIQLVFDTEENRRKWVASPQHKLAWPAASGLAKEYKWHGYDVISDHDNRQ